MAAQSIKHIFSHVHYSDFAIGAAAAVAAWAFSPQQTYERVAQAAILGVSGLIASYIIRQEDPDEFKSWKLSITHLTSLAGSIVAANLLALKTLEWTGASRESSSPVSLLISGAIGLFGLFSAATRGDDDEDDEVLCSRDILSLAPLSAGFAVVAASVALGALRLYAGAATFLKS